MFAFLLLFDVNLFYDMLCYVLSFDVVNGYFFFYFMCVIRNCWHMNLHSSFRMLVLA